MRTWRGTVLAAAEPHAAAVATLPNRPHAFSFSAVRPASTGARAASVQNVVGRYHASCPRIGGGTRRHLSILRK
jgi:hypothetical protein